LTPHDGQAPAIRIECLGRRFGDLWALRGVDLELAPGEVFGLLGPNGAGKTTTVRLLTSLIAPTEGRAWVDGYEVTTDADLVRARIGILTETPGLYDRLTATQNLDFFARLHGLDPTTRTERIERFMRLFELWDRRDDLAGTFSKGMKQKLAIARALIHEPSVVFLDEPTAALDPEAAFVVREAIASLRGAGRTIVLCTHNLDEAERLCDRIGFVRGGLLRVDSPTRLRGGDGNGGGPILRVQLVEAPTPAQLAAVAAVAGVSHVERPMGGGGERRQWRGRGQWRARRQWQGRRQWGERCRGRQPHLPADRPALRRAPGRPGPRRGGWAGHRCPRVEPHARGRLLRGHGPSAPGRGRHRRGRSWRRWCAAQDRRRRRR
jgi:ABC-2 type transport system ATP-binding protein